MNHLPVLAATAFGWDSVPGWATVIALVLFGRMISRGKAGDAIDIMQKANDVLTKRIETLEGENKALAAEVQKLKRERSLEPIMAEILEQFQHHEARAQERFEVGQRFVGEQNQRLLGLFDLIGKQLGKEHETL